MQVRPESHHREVPWGPPAHLSFPNHCKYNSTKTSVKWTSGQCPLDIQVSNSSYIPCTLQSQVCAIVGGTFTVAGIIDSCIFSGEVSYFSNCQESKTCFHFSNIHRVLTSFFQRLKSSRSLSWENLIKKKEISKTLLTSSVFCYCHSVNIAIWTFVQTIDHGCSIYCIINLHCNAVILWNL